MITTTTHVHLGVLLPAFAATATREPRTAAEARQWCDEQNAAAKKRRDEDDAAHQRKMKELAALGEQAKRFVGTDVRRPARPGPRHGAQVSLCVAAIYRERNGQPAADSGRQLNTTEVYAAMNRRHDTVRGYVPLGAGGRAAVDRVNDACRTGAR
jgi:hypothetical protein